MKILVGFFLGAHFFATPPIRAQTLELSVTSINEADISAIIGAIAHDSTGGRATPSPGLEGVANYIAGRFFESGVEPLLPSGSFESRYPLSSYHFDRDLSGVAADDFFFSLGQESQIVFATDPPAERSGEVVILSGELIGDQISQRSLSGKVVLIVKHFEPGADVQASITSFMPSIFFQGPAAMLLISDRSDSEFTSGAALAVAPQVAPSWVNEEGFSVGFLEVRGQAIAAALLDRGFDVMDALAHPNRPLVVTPMPETNVVIRFARSRPVRSSAPNVVGVVRGSDPNLMNEFVLISAHMDHLGMASGIGDDNIYNGADDNGSGTAAVLELADAFAALTVAPRRSVVFLLVSGEEMGLWGSDFFTSFPPIPLENVVADLNVDMVGRNWADTIVAIGKEHSDLGVSLATVVSDHPELNLAVIDDPWPEEGLYQRSDHINFATRGVPILFFTSGIHDDYHKVTDEPQTINNEKVSRVARMLFYLAYELANADDRPVWNPESREAIVSK